MDEEEIASNLRRNIHTQDDFVLAEKPEPNTTNGQATIAPDYELDEIVQYKLHDFFGEPYQPNDEIGRQQLSFIYKKVSGMVENQDYGFVVAKIRDLERIIGTAERENRIYRLYQWLKLDSMRRSVEAEMGAISQ